MTDTLKKLHRKIRRFGWNTDECCYYKRYDTNIYGTLDCEGEEITKLEFDICRPAASLGDEEICISMFLYEKNRKTGDIHYTGHQQFARISGKELETLVELYHEHKKDTERSAAEQSR